MTAPAREVSARSSVVALLTALYFAQGLPYGFFVTALPVVLRQSGYSLVAISATGVLFAPWALKVLWAPCVDRFGTRKRWVVSMQIATAAIALGLACLDLDASTVPLFVGVALINVFAATQDVATDGIAVTALDARGRGLGNGIQVGAYRLGMIAGGGGLLWVYSFTSWRILFVVMAAVLLLTTIPVLWLRDGGTPRPRPGSASPVAWWSRLLRPGVFGLIGLVAAYKFGNSMGSALVGPFLSDLGLTLRQIALLDGAVSSGAALVGAALGGLLAFRVGRPTALLVGGIAQSAALVAFVAAAADLGGLPMIVVATVGEHVCGGIATVAVFALMMDSADRAFAGTDYTLLASAVVVVQGVAGFAAGIVGDAVGYVALYSSATVLSALGCVVMMRGLRGGAGPDRLREALAPVGVH
ncbi:MFS transporter [Williamsia deligens]|uniref:MFS transporter n=1 Tax=Williamsia deligens TaxID=321325 RepID=A0ABW3G943_9NOCA|nr:MFS transporter [Williamsia deligens]MCP2192431.1 Major Facilitator Superfamily protein [Williamsia deligens]